MSDVNRIRSHVYFPDELIVNILSRLPVKSLLRFMSVCKLWYSMIKNPNFVSSHFNHHSKEGPKYLMYRLKGDDFDRYRVYADTDNFDMHLKFRNAGYRLICRIVGCCNGIICYRNIRKKSIVLWNSSVRKSLEIKLPNCTISDDYYGEKFIFWFGFDVASNDYKVIWAVYASDDLMTTTSFGVYIYSLNERTWRSIDSSFEMYECEECEIADRGIYLNGVIHWVALTGHDERNVPETVLTFNLADEKFDTFKLPKEIVFVEQNFHLMDIEEGVPRLFDGVNLMTVKRGSKDCLVAFHENLTSLNLWVLEHDEGYWVNEFYSSKNSVETILNYRVNGDIVLQLHCGLVISSDYCYDRLEVLSPLKMDYVGDYMENLVFFLD